MHIECPICYEEYDSEKHVPCIGTCGHTICDVCRTRIDSKKCPHCNRKNALANKMVNRQLLDLIRVAQVVKMPSVDSTSNRQKCSKCGVESKKLRICLDCSMKSGIVRKFRAAEEYGNTQEVIRNIEENAAICGDCVIDDGHSKHNAMLFETFLKEYNSFLE
ncbi:unnamed protein product [Caenorhabditis sp. 36 PRJEB53466]|nr:unnamed protein product [Caenorhabditis sp. 36 PRJEB53466]